GLFSFQAEDGIRDRNVTGVQTCALPISPQDSPCLRGLALAGTRLLRGTLRHARIGKLTDLPDDMMRCADRGARKCPTAPTLQARSEERRVGKGLSIGWGSEYAN